MWSELNAVNLLLEYCMSIFKDHCKLLVKQTILEWKTIGKLMWSQSLCDHIWEDSLQKGILNRVSQNAPQCILASDIVHMAVSIPQEPPNKISWVLGHFCGVATIFCIYKGNSEKYKGKYAIGPFLLSFLTERSNQLNSCTRMLHLYCIFRIHLY